MTRAAALLLLLAGAGCSAPGAGTGPVADVPLHRVERTRFAHEVTAEGHLSAVRSTPVTVPVSAQSAYTIAWVAEDGVPVGQGEVIVRFDRTELEKRLEDGAADLESTRNRIRKQEAEVGAQLRNLDRDVEVARRTVDAAREFRPRDETIFSRQEIIEGDIDLDLAEARRRHAEQARRRREAEARSQTELLDIDERQARTVIERAEEGLASVEVRAPHDGILLLERNWRGEPIRAGSTVWQGQPLARIPDLSTMEAQVHVLEADAGGLRVGLAARVVVEAHPDLEVEARVARVDDLAKPRVRGVPVQYFGVTLELSETDASFMKPGQRVRARLAMDVVEDVIVLPRQAVFERDGERVAWVLRGESFVPVALQFGPGTPGRVVVTDGLRPGDLVALSDPAAS